MISNKPYLVRAIHKWCHDAGLTAHILVDTSVPRTKVPEDYVESNRIVLNIADSATENLVIGDESIDFLANFGQKVVNVRVPMDAVLAVCARETGDGINFGDDDDEDSGAYYDEDIALDDCENSDIDQSKRNKLVLTIIK